MKRRDILTAIALGMMGITAILSSQVLFQQVVQGHTDLTRNIPTRIGEWEMVNQAEASASEIRGLETGDIIKRTYTNGSAYMELVVAYISHSSRKSAHAQEACLRGAGALVGSINDFTMRNSRVDAKLISIDIHDRRQWVCYWYKIGSLHTAQYLRSSLIMFLGGLAGKKGQGASLIRLLTPEIQGESRERIQDRMEDFTRVLLPELEKTLP